ncbi:MAG: MBL fold metallo-hydrolase [Chloroflexota bacterium]
MIILDAGSGIRALGETFDAGDAVLLLSHYHWDHIQGYPFFAPLYADNCAITIFGPDFDGRGPYEYLAGQVVQPYFPAPSAQWQGVTRYSVTPSEPFSVGAAIACATRLSHPGHTLGYRLDDGGASLVYISDNEVDCASPELLTSIVDFAAGADVLIHDCQYRESEYGMRRGWGHSTPRQAVHVAQRAGVKALYLFHHDPSHTDRDVETMAEEARGMAGNLEVNVAREGNVVTIGGECAANTAGD